MLVDRFADRIVRQKWARELQHSRDDHSRKWWPVVWRLCDPAALQSLCPASAAVTLSVRPDARPQPFGPLRVMLGVQRPTRCRKADGLAALPGM
eukprot:3484708-Prymnesium_polylepis.1